MAETGFKRLKRTAVEQKIPRPNLAAALNPPSVSITVCYFFEWILQDEIIRLAVSLRSNDDRHPFPCDRI